MKTNVLKHDLMSFKFIVKEWFYCKRNVEKQRKKEERKTSHL